MPASPPITLTWETDPGLLTDNVGSELHVDVNSDSKLAISCKLGATPMVMRGGAS